MVKRNNVLLFEHSFYASTTTGVRSTIWDMFTFYAFDYNRVEHILGTQ